MSAIFQAITISDSPLALSFVSCSSTALALFIVFLPLSQGGQTDDGVALLRIELVHLKEAVQVANARYKDWKDAHPAEVVDPMTDKLYCDLIARSRFYRD